MNLRKSIVAGLFVSTLMMILVSFTAQTASHKKGKTDDKGKMLFRAYCSTCHMLPDPGSLTKDIWKMHVLPVMASRMGIIYPNYDPLKGLSDEEKVIVKKNHIIPDQPFLPEADWNELVKYVLDSAPDSIPYEEKRLTRNGPLTQFKREDVQIYANGTSLITGLKFNPATQTLWVGSYNNQVMSWKYDVGVTKETMAKSPVVDFNFYNGNTYFTEIGKLYPTELNLGAYTQCGDSISSPVISNLHRPVHTVMEDLDNDGVPEIVMCNFGNKTGSLSLFKKDKSGKYTEDVLLPVAGAIKCEVKDMDGDGKKDIVALFAQGDESVYIFYNQGNLKFKAKRVLRFPPDYGTTDMVLVDYNHDGLTDIVTVHGDNADYSNILKPYHGIRLSINQGKGVFKEKFFYPIYGVTKVLACDFDKDGDIDFVASAFFPDFGKLVDESFVYLENIDQNKFSFKSSILKSDVPLRTLTLELADIDGDGDMDVIGGNFSLGLGHPPKELGDKWKNAKYGLNIFINQLYQPKK